MGQLDYFLRREKVDRDVERRLRRMLSAGPWCWPTEPDALRGAKRFVSEGPSEPAPGEVLLVTVGKQAAPNQVANLWAVSFSSVEGTGHPFGREALDAWSDAAVALTRSVPVLWRSVRDARARQFNAVPLTGIALSPGAQVIPERVVDGRSFGVSFLLSLAALVLGEAVPANVAASAQIDAEGRVDEVDSLPEKIRAILECAPGVTNILVFADQEQAAAEAVRLLGADGWVSIEPVSTGADVVTAVFEDRFEKMVADAGTRDDDREELFESLRTLALTGRDAVLDWTPVERAGELALGWPALSEEERWWLEFIVALARRHETNQGRLPPWDEERVDQLPAPIRLSVVANYVQQCSDTGEPSAREIQGIWGRYAVRGREAYVPHLRLQGAVARLLAVAGEPERALESQEEAARGFFERLEYVSISYPLSEWYRLAGVLRDHEAFERAEAFAQKVLLRGGLGFDGNPFVELSRCKAIVLLGAMPYDEAATALERLDPEESSLGRDAPPHVRWSAVRWRIRLLEDQGQSGAVEGFKLLELAASGSGGHSQTAQVFRTLIELDGAIRESDEKLREATVMQLEKLDPGPVGHLLAAASSHQADGPRYVADFYPY